jgi:hypothetical protein
VTAGFSESDPHRMIPMRDFDEELSLAEITSSCGQVSINATRCEIPSRPSLTAEARACSWVRKGAPLFRSSSLLSFLSRASLARARTRSKLAPREAAYSGITESSRWISGSLAKLVLLPGMSSSGDY